MQQNGEIGNKESKGDALLEPEFEQAKLDGGTTKLPELSFGRDIGLEGNVRVWSIKTAYREL